MPKRKTKLQKKNVEATKTIEKPIEQTKIPKLPEGVAFQCPHCNHIIKYRNYKGMIKEDDYQTSNTALHAIIYGCPKCGKINQPMYEKVMIVRNPKKR